MIFAREIYGLEEFTRYLGDVHYTFIPHYKLRRAVLRATLRNNISYFQTMRQKGLSLLENPRKAKKAAKVAAA